MFFTRALLEFHFTHVHDTGNGLVQVGGFVLFEAHNVEGFLGQAHFFLIIDTFDGQLSLGREVVVLDVVGQLELFAELWVEAGHDLVEDVVGTFSWSLTDDTRLLKKI